MQENLRGDDVRRPLLISVPAAAKIIGFSIPTARAEIRAGALPATKIGGKTYVRRTDVAAYVGSLGRDNANG